MLVIKNAIASDKTMQASVTPAGAPAQPVTARPETAKSEVARPESNGKTDSKTDSKAEPRQNAVGIGGGRLASPPKR